MEPRRVDEPKRLRMSEMRRVAGAVGASTIAAAVVGSASFAIYGALHLVLNPTSQLPSVSPFFRIVPMFLSFFFFLPFAIIISIVFSALVGPLLWYATRGTPSKLTGLFYLAGFLFGGAFFILWDVLSSKWQAADLIEVLFQPFWLVGGLAGLAGGRAFIRHMLSVNVKKSHQDDDSPQRP